MLAILIGSVIYIIVFIVAASLITTKVTKDVSDEKLKNEYRK
jgi:hypothetical protein